MNLKRYFLFLLALLVLDWALGALHAAGMIPLWPFLLANFPCGIPFVWVESHWAGTHYAVAGHTFDETWSFVAFGFAVLAQAAVYTLVLEALRARCSSRGDSQSEPLT